MNNHWRRCRLMQKRIPFIVYHAHLGAKFQTSLTASSKHQARVEYGSESSIVSEPRTLGGLVLPLWGILTPQLPSVAQRLHEAAAISSIHREFTDLRNIPRQRVISFFYLDCSVIHFSSSATKRHFGRISSRASVFIRLYAIYSPSFQLRLSN